MGIKRYKALNTLKNWFLGIYDSNKELPVVAEAEDEHLYTNVRSKYDEVLLQANQTLQQEVRDLRTQNKKLFLDVTLELKRIVQLKREKVELINDRYVLAVAHEKLQLRNSQLETEEQRRKEQEKTNQDPGVLTA